MVSDATHVTLVAAGVLMGLEVESKETISAMGMLLERTFWFHE
jgi:hypothetical protein